MTIAHRHQMGVVRAVVVDHKDLLDRLLQGEWDAL
jgi:hypothetical protein